VLIPVISGGSVLRPTLFIFYVNDTGHLADIGVSQRIISAICWRYQVVHCIKRQYLCWLFTVMFVSHLSTVSSLAASIISIIMHCRAYCISQATFCR